MGSTKEWVSFSGTLKGITHPGLAATCSGHALKVTLMLGGPVGWDRFEIERVSQELPWGWYEFSANGRTDRVELTAGGWHASS